MKTEPSHLGWTTHDREGADWLVGGGQMGRAVRAFDWSKTALGPIGSWSEPLRTTVSLCLNSRFPMFVWWGPELINIYNDADVAVLGLLHPTALGRRAPELWPDVWPVIKPQIDSVFEHAEASWSYRLGVITNRNGYDEEAYFTYSHSPVFENPSTVGGLICVVIDETPQVLAERRQSLLVEVSDLLRNLNSPREIIAAAVEALGRHLKASRAGYGQVQSDDKTVLLETGYANGVKPLTGAFPLESFGLRNVARQRSGSTVVHNDIEEDEADTLATWAAAEIRAFVSVPLVRDGRFRAALYVNQSEVRCWSRQDVALIEEVAERLWEALERARAEEQLRQSGRRQAFLLQLMQGQRESPDPESMMQAATEVVGSFLNVDRTGFFEIGPDDMLKFKIGWTAGRLPLLTDAFPALGIGSRYLSEVRAGKTLGISDVRTSPLTQDSMFAQIGTVSLIGAPILRNGEWHAGLYVNHAEPRLWTDEEINFVREVADRTWDAIERAQAELARRESDERLSFALDAGGGLGTWDYDVPNDRIFCSARFAQLYSVAADHASAGAPLSEFLRAIHPDDRDEAARSVQRAILNGGDYLAEYRVVLADGSVRWLFARGRVALDKLGLPMRFTGVVFDVTDRRSVELRDAFLVRLDDAVRPLTDPQEITQVAARLLGEHLDANRCAYADVEPDEDSFNLTGDFNRGVESIVGRYAFRDFGDDCLSSMRQGRAYVVQDSEVDPRTATVRQSYRSTRIRSVICVPMLKQGRFVAIMAVHHATPRQWRPDEIELVQQVAGRCWESIERSRVTRELQQREHRYRFLAESIPQMVWTARPDGELDYASRQVAQYFGIEPEEALGTAWLRWVHPEDQELSVQRWQRSITSGQSYETSFRLRRGSDASWRWHLVRALPLLDAGGTIVQWFGTCTDIEDQKRAEALLHQQWHTFDTALSHTPDFTYTFDLQGRFTYVNRALLALWQIPLADALGKNFFDLGYPPQLADRLQRQIQRVIDGKQPVRDQTPYTGPTGTTGHYEYIFVPVLSADGRVDAVAGSTRDVTERDRIEKALAASEEQLQQVFAQAPVAIAVFRGSDFMIEMANPFYQSMLQGRAPAGRRLADSIPELSQNVWEAFHRVLESGEPFVATDFLIPYDQDGDGVVEDHWFNVVYHPLRDRNQSVTGIVAVCSDVTVQVRARQGLERVNRELEEFAYVASHDLQEPLRMVNIYTQLLLRRFIGENPEAQEYAGIVRQGVTRMEALIRDLLKFSRTVQSVELPDGIADLSSSLADALSVLKSRIADSGAIITVSALPTTRGETAQMSHVFQNLISNSLKYSDPSRRPEIHVSAKNKKGESTISIQDNGIGFEQQYAERIFGLFKRLHNDEYPGTGLGLAICKRIVERYGGRIWADGRPSEGSTFHFSLPRMERR